MRAHIVHISWRIKCEMFRPPGVLKGDIHSSRPAFYLEMYCEKQQSHFCNPALILLFPVCHRSTLEEVPIINTSPLSFPYLKWFIYYGIVDSLCPKNVLMKRSCHLCSLHIKKGYLSFNESSIYGALWEQSFPACKLFTPLSFKSTVLMEGQEGE